MRLTALWWWIDRWRKSTAYMDMTLEEQGAYRNLLDEAHLRGGYLPADERILAKACGDALAWPRVRKTILKKFLQTPNGLVNETLSSVMTESKRRSRKQANYRERVLQEHDNGNGAGNGAGNDIGNALQPPVPVPVLRSGSGSGSEYKQQASSESRGSTTSKKRPPAENPGTARSKRPIFTGQRLTVFEWMLDDCVKTLGDKLANDFDLHEWFFALDAEVVKQDIVIPKRDGGAWLQQQLVTEARKRGLPFTQALSPITAGNLAAGARFLAREAKHDQR